MKQEIESLENNLKYAGDLSLQNWSLKYFQKNKRRYQYELKLIEQNYTGGGILEIGSAPFHLTYMLKKRNYPVTGIDINPKRFDEFIKEHDLNVYKCNIETEPLPFPDNSFDFILFNEIFEHLRLNPIDTLLEINRVLTPQGKLILTTPNLYNIRNVTRFILGKGIGDPYFEFKKLHTIGHMGHVREYSVSQMKIFLLNTGFESFIVTHKSYNILKGLWLPLNLVKKIIPVFNTYQIHICRNIKHGDK